MKVIVVLFSFSFISLASVAQLSIIKLPKIFDSNVQISSLGYTAHALYAFGEKNKTLFILSTHRGKRSDSFELLGNPIDLKQFGLKSKQSICVEGMSFYGENIFLSDDCEGGVFCTDLSGKFYKVNISPENVANELRLEIGEKGNEGIAINTKKNLCYLMKEWDGGNTSKLRTFKIETGTDGKFNLTKVGNDIIIEHENTCNHWRYTDIFYDTNKNILVALRSQYDSKNSCSEYVIDSIKLDTNSRINREKLYSKNLVWIDKKGNYSLSSFVHKFSNQYNTNLEGISIVGEGNIIYLISDNSYNGSTKKTMLIKFDTASWF